MFSNVSEPANVSDFHLLLKCRAIELYANATDFTLPRQCGTLLSQLNNTFIVSSGIALAPTIGELMNVSDPEAVFGEIRQFRLAALSKLDMHVNKTVEAIYRQLNESQDVDEAINNVDRGIETLTRLRNLLDSVNASNRTKSIVENHIKLLNTTRQFILAASRVDDTSDNAQTLYELERIEEQLRQCTSTMPQQWAENYMEWLITLFILKELFWTDHGTARSVARDYVRSKKSITEVVRDVQTAKKRSISSGSSSSGKAGNIRSSSSVGSSAGSRSTSSRSSQSGRSSSTGGSSSRSGSSRGGGSTGSSSRGTRGRGR
jgi:hypothetical protein